MKRRLISLVLVLMLVMTAGCGKKSTTKKLKTEDLDETTLQGMAKDITKEMSLKNKIGQLFMVSVYQLDEAESKNQTSVTSQMKKTLKKYPAGGVIMFAKNINTPDQTKKMTDELQDASYIPLFMAVDEEGGQVSRVASNPKMKMTVYPSAQEVGRTYNNKKIEALRIGINLPGQLGPLQGTVTAVHECCRSSVSDGCAQRLRWNQPSRRRNGEVMRQLLLDSTPSSDFS